MVSTAADERDGMARRQPPAKTMDDDRRTSDLRGRIYDLLRAEIRDGRHAEDIVFGEHAIARAFSVSRTPAREALALLARRGMLVPRRRGFEFPRFTPREIDEIFEVRLLLEPWAMRGVARSAAPEDRRRLAEACAEDLGEAFVPGSPEAVAALDRVQRRLSALVANPVLADLAERHADKVAVHVAALLRDPAEAERGRGAAAAIVTAVARGDGPDTERLTVARLDALRDALRRRAEEGS
jgi:DNA-binding GntR family transcriptional regulator